MIKFKSSGHYVLCHVKLIIRTFYYFQKGEIGLARKSMPGISFNYKQTKHVSKKTGQL
jgi:hypothetical protein